MTNKMYFIKLSTYMFFICKIKLFLKYELNYHHCWACHLCICIFLLSFYSKHFIILFTIYFWTYKLLIKTLKFLNAQNFRCTFLLLIFNFILLQKLQQKGGTYDIDFLRFALGTTLQSNFINVSCLLSKNVHFLIVGYRHLYAC